MILDLGFVCTLFVAVAKIPNWKKLLQSPDITANVSTDFGYVVVPPTSTTNPIPERPLTPSIQKPQYNTLNNWRAPHDTESFNTKPSL
jgi:hypothetical protein